MRSASCYKLWKRDFKYALRYDLGRRALSVSLTGSGLL